MSTWGYRNGYGGTGALGLIFDCVLLLVTRWKPVLFVNGPTWSILDGLDWFLVGMVEITDSKSDSTGVVRSAKITLGKMLV